MNFKKRKILYISGTRADYGLMRDLLFLLKKNNELEIEIIATGLHLMPEFGKTIKEIKKDGFLVNEIKAVYNKDDKNSMSFFVGEFIQLLSKKIKKIKPDMILVMGDRGEMLAGAVVGAYLTIPVIHIHGGEVTQTVDELIRHAITKISTIHFAATKKSVERIIRMGENPSRVFWTGAPGLFNSLKEKLFSKKEIIEKYHLDSSKPILIVLQNSVTLNFNFLERQIEETMKAIRELGLQTIVIYPNADAGGRKIISVIEKYRKLKFIKIYKNIPHKDYLSLLKLSNVLVGNSSSGIIEAPSFHLPVVNIGERQNGREKSSNIINVNYNSQEIKNAIKKAIYDKDFIKSIEKFKNPYYKGNSEKKIVDILSKIKINRKLLEKQITY